MPRHNIIAIGALAGGIAAIERFFENTPAGTGMAFVVILHLSPEYESNLAAVIQRHTDMPVTQVTEEVKVEPNHVYVIPPSKHLSMHDGNIRLSPPEREQTEELLKAYADMEERVRQRTADLETLNERLQAEIADREAANEARRDLTRRLVYAQEVERQSIARELHDQMGQSLTGLRFMLDIVAKQLPKDQRERIAEAGAIINDLADQVNRLSFNLRPSVLDDMGVLPALLQIIEQFTDQTGIEVDFHHRGLETRYDPEVETAIFRVVQEALTNVARHSGAEKACVYALSDDGLMLRIEEKGQGFNPNSMLPTADSHGLRSMRERIELLGGQFTVESEPGKGTSLIAEIPKAALGDRWQASGR